MTLASERKHRVYPNIASGFENLIRKLLCQTGVGTRMCISLLDNMLRSFEADEGSIEAQAFDIRCSFNRLPCYSRLILFFSYAILSHIIEEGLAATLYQQFIM